jgi:predicted restriction endonuclease
MLYAEAHHIKPLGAPHNGPDVRANILCVCPNDHVLLDYGAIKLYGNHLKEVGQEYIDYHNENIYAKNWYNKANSADTKSHAR